MQPLLAWTEELKMAKCLALKVEYNNPIWSGQGPLYWESYFWLLVDTFLFEYFDTSGVPTAPRTASLFADSATTEPAKVPKHGVSRVLMLRNVIIVFGRYLTFGYLGI